MHKNVYFKSYFSFAIIAAIVYSIPVYFFIRAADYTQSALLYVGNFLFMIVIGIFLFYIRRWKGTFLRMIDLIIAGQKQVVRSVAASLIGAVLLLLLSGPGLFTHNLERKAMVNKPVNTVYDKTNGLNFMVIVNSAIGNFLTGSFVTVILSASLSGRLRKKNQTS